MIEIVLLGQPRGKERPRLTKAGHVYTPEKTRDYEAALKFAAKEAMGERAPLDGPLRVDIMIRRPIPQSWPKKRQEAARRGELRPTTKPDFDNYAKTVDALNLVVWIDDGQVVDGRVQKFYSDKPGMWIRVSPIVQEEGIFG
jgi:Holliday junction resolvase RusA-like endonuclease